MNKNSTQIEVRLWDAADEMQENSNLKSSEHSVPVLGLIFLRYADNIKSLSQLRIMYHFRGHTQLFNHV